MRRTTLALLTLASVALPLMTARTASGFACIRTSNGRCIHWAEGAATLRSFLGTPSGSLINGTLSWDQNATNAANDWNALGAAFGFTVAVDGGFANPCGRQGAGHACNDTGPVDDNPVFFADSFCGRGFGDIIELTNNCFNPDDGAMFNAPVFVNANVRWNAYDGPIRFADRQVVYDIRRVLLHEFGHVLGLAHPDETGQTVEAIMNSRVSNLDRLRGDDIDGIFALYPSSPPPGASSGSSGCQVQRVRAPGALWLLMLPFVLGLYRRTISRRPR